MSAFISVGEVSYEIFYAYIDIQGNEEARTRDITL